MQVINRIGILTSGGDAPGMNAAIRAITRTALYHGIRVSGIRRGYQGLIEGDIEELEIHSVSNIIHRGGTILKTARSMEFKTEEGMEKAYLNVKKFGIDALVIIGGDGSFRGALAFTQKYPGLRAVGIAGTIDNDLYGTDYTLGFDTALNTVVDAVDKIRDTANSHNRLFFIEVMGRDAGFIALRSGIAVGAEDIFVPETESDISRLVQKLKNHRRANKASGIIIVAEGDDMGGAMEVSKIVAEKLPDFDIRVSILGHIQRGGNPSCLDRVLASQYGYYSVKALLNGMNCVMIGIVNKEVVFTPFEKTVKHNLEINRDMLEMANIISI